MLFAEDEKLLALSLAIAPPETLAVLLLNSASPDKVNCDPKLLSIAPPLPALFEVNVDFPANLKVASSLAIAPPLPVGSLFEPIALLFLKVVVPSISKIA